MNARNRLNLRRACAVTGSLALVGFFTSTPAFADSGSGPVKVVNTETVQVYMTADGDIESKRVYEQVGLYGHGTVDVKNPVSTDGLRNLNGFAGFSVSNGDQVIDTKVDGTKRYRSVSTFDKALPVQITPSYVLDGKKVGPHGIVGKSGHLEVTYTVTNKTAAPQEVTIPDGSGGTVTKTADVPIPMVGSLTTTLPKTFTNVDPHGANTAGDGAGGLTMSYTMTLFPPLGSDTATLTYSADITDGVVPEANVSMLPVDPLASPTFKTAADSYQGGANTGAELVSGAGQIDTNLLKLRDGASELLAGLIQLRNGADQLHSGLADDAAPGAKKLAAGAGDLSDGLGQLDSGAGQLSDGSKKLAAGAGDAYAGSKKLRSGAAQLSGGLDTASSGGMQLDLGAQQLLAGQKALAAGIEQLYAGVQALPTTVQTELATDPQYQALLGALGQVITGIGTLADQPQADPNNNTLLGGLNGLKYGLRYPGVVDCTQPTSCGVIDAAEAAKAYVDAVLGAGGLTGLQSTQLGGASQLLTGAVSGGAQLRAGIDLMRSKISTGVSPTTCVSNPSGCGAREALLAVQGGIPQLVSALTANIRDTLLASIGTGAPGCDPTQTLQCGANATVAGTQQLADGITQLAGGLNQLQAGGAQLSSGAGDLVSGLGQIDGGANDLSAGAKKLAAGASDASAGGTQVADGAQQLSDGLGSAADGSGQLADGLTTAAGGAPQLVDGAQRLSTEGMGPLKEAGKKTALNYGEMYAVIKAGSEKAHTNSMAYGAPAGAEGLTAYSFTIKGENGEGNRNLARGTAGLALLGLGGGAFALRRRGLGV